MQIDHIRLSKSKTIGILTQNGTTKFQKVQMEAGASLIDTDSPIESYKELSQFIDKCFELEAGNKK